MVTPTFYVGVALAIGKVVSIKDISYHIEHFKRGCARTTD